MKNKATILPGLMLFASFVILMVCGMGFDFVFSRFPSLGIVLIELLAFVPPTYCLYKSQDQNFRLNFRWEKQPDQAACVLWIYGKIFPCGFFFVVSQQFGRLCCVRCERH